MCAIFSIHIQFSNLWVYIDAIIYWYSGLPICEPCFNLILYEDEVKLTLQLVHNKKPGTTRLPLTLVIIWDFQRWKILPSFLINCLEWQSTSWCSWCLSTSLQTGGFLLTNAGIPVKPLIWSRKWSKKMYT